MKKVLFTVSFFLLLGSTALFTFPQKTLAEVDACNKKDVYTVYGKVIYTIRSGGIYPAAGDKVKATRECDGQIFKTFTDANGKYSLSLPRSMYLIEVHDKYTNEFLPFYGSVREDMTKNFEARVYSVPTSPTPTPISWTK